MMRLIFFKWNCHFSNFPYIFVLSKPHAMFDFDQYLGFIAFLTIVTIGFWLMMFLLLFVIPYWVGGNLLEMWKERREAKRAEREA